MGMAGDFDGLVRFVVHGCSDRQQVPRLREVHPAGGAGKQAIVADAVEAARQDMEEEAPDKLVGGDAS